MMDTTPADVIKSLQRFKHATRTNAAKKTLTNHDAMAYLVWCLGPTRVQDLVDFMLAWRFGEPKYRTEDVWRWDGTTRTSVRVGTREFPELSFSYLFNDSVFGGYGFVGASLESPGNYMHSDRYSASKFKNQEEGRKAHAEHRSSKERDTREGNCVFFRRTYWYRAKKAIYAPTLECAKRMAELAPMFSS